MANWQKAAALAGLAERPAVFKSGRRQIALFLVGDDVYAVDNRCPHEGYPLAQGTVDGECVLTCNWHNWKFRLGDGECVLGGDHVRTYPVKRQDGHVWVDLADPPPDQIRQEILRGLQTAFVDRDFGRICREIARLHYNGLDSLTAVRKAVEWSHDRLEFGTTHAFAAAADWLALAETFSADFEKQLTCLGETVDHMAFDALRHPQYPYAAAGPPYEDARFLQAVEAEDRALAEGMIRSALDDGLHWNDLQPSFAASALAHYNDFGHSLIYVYKTGQLIEAGGAELEPFLIPALVRHLCYTTREDLIPEFKAYAAALDGLPELSIAAPGGNGESLTARFPATLAEAFDWLRREAAAHDVAVLYDALLSTLARSLLHYDLAFQSAYDRPVSQNVGWLDFTHGITFANAVRATCEKLPHLWPSGLLQMACFVGRNRPYLDLDLNEDEWFVGDREAFFASVQETLLDHGLRDPIFSAHLVKTILAVQEELPNASPDTQRYLLAALNRFLHSPLKQKHVRRLARQAIDLVKRDFD